MTKTITYDELYEQIIKFIKNEKELDFIKKAYDFASLKHQGKMRRNNEPYISHPLGVASILAEQNVDYITIAAALIHETINHTETTYKEILDNFGEETAKIVLSVSKINRLELADEKETSLAYLRKISVGMAEDVRVLVIKLADRLHNMRTAYALTEEEQVSKAKETMNILIPIAHRLGINTIKSELEDWCLRYLEPKKYEEIQQKLNSTKEEMNCLIDEMKEKISDILTDHGIPFSIKGRVKSIYSIYKKLEKGRKWEDIYDILALRVFVEKESDCYLAVGLIHSKFKPIPKRFKDYIAVPKSNMYQSLHTTVFGIDGNLFEIQIRTYEMDEIAEKGIASHWSYKEKGTVKIQHVMEQKLELFRSVIEANNNANTSNSDFASTINKEIFSDLIYCFTPKGDVVELPVNSTPLDFAFRIHSKVGEHTSGAIVNDNMVPLNHKLHDGDIVKILTNVKSSPKKHWLKIVVTSQAKNKIKSYFSKKDKETYIEVGKEQLDKQLRKEQISHDDFYNNEKITKLLQELKLQELDDLYFAIGSFRYTASFIVTVFLKGKDNSTDIFLKKAHNLKDERSNFSKDILVNGQDGIHTSIAKCCKPIPGDDIVGYITKTDGIVVHKRNCINLKNTKNIVDVSWVENTGKYQVNIIIVTDTVANYLLNIMTIASKTNVVIDNFSTIENESGNSYVLTLKISSTKDLNEFLKHINNENHVIKAERKL